MPSIVFKRLRHVIGVLTFFALLCMSNMRVNLSVAIGAMTASSKNKSSNEILESNACGNEANISSMAGNKKTEQMGEFEWDEFTQSFVIGAFYYGFTVGGLVAGPFVQRFGVRWFSGLAMLTCSILSLLTPISAYCGPGFLISLRCIQGILQGVLVPTTNMVVSEWAPIMERSRFFTLVASGISFGSVLGMYLSGILASSSWGWPSVFYVSGGLGVIWYILWMSVVFDSPSTHPFISGDEKCYILKNQNSKKNEKIPNKVPWKAILKSPPVWAYWFTYGCQLTCLYFLMIEMPIYLYKILHFNIRMSGTLSAIPFILRIISSYSCSFAADAMRKSGKVSINFIRKLLDSIGSFSAGLCLLSVAFAGCHTNVIVGLLCACTAFSGVLTSGCSVTVVDMSPRFSATLGGIAYTIANSGGALLPYIVSEVTKSGQTLQNWSWVFIISAAIYFSGGIIFFCFANANVQPWDSNGTIEDDKDVPSEDVNLTKM